MNIERMRDALFSQDETCGFIERETAIHEFLLGNVPETQPKKYVSALEYVLSRLSCPVDPDDLIVGRMVLGEIPYEMEPVPGNGFSHVGNPFIPFDRCAGHMSLDFSELVKIGLSGIVRRIRENADTPEKEAFYECAVRSAEAVRAFSCRYAKAAEEAGKDRAAKALRRVPYEGAVDFFSALQSVWMMEMILSCVTGGRDFAYSRLDLALFPFYDPAPEKQADQLELLESFLLLTNTLGGLNSDLKNQMPVPCSAGNIYLMLGGTGAEKALKLSLLFLDAAEAVKLPQPVLAVRLSKTSDPVWRLRTAELTEELSGQMSFYNDDALIPNLRRLGFSEEHAVNYTMSGCNRAEFMGHRSSDHFHNCAKRFLNAFYDPEVTDFEGLLSAFKREMEAEAEEAPGSRLFDPAVNPRFFLESLLLRGCVESACDLENGGQFDESVDHHLMGLATAANSLAAVKKAVFTDHTLTLDEFRALTRSNFEADPGLGSLIRNRFPKFGNDDPEADECAADICGIIADAVSGMKKKTGRIHIPGLYSLWFHHDAGKRTGATPDGRLSGEPLSENQSPVYGTDREGITALLLSAGKLPLDKVGAAGFNVRLEKKIAPGLLDALTAAYFSMGGINLCVDVMDRATLVDAAAHPERYPTLCVRIVGYSEIFVRLPAYLQQEMIDRTEISV